MGNQRAWNNKKSRVLNRDGNRCKYCGEKFWPNQLTLDHVVARSAGGSNNESNLVTCCRDCNSQKGSMPVAEFMSFKAARGQRVSVPFPKWQALAETAQPKAAE